MSRQRLPWLMLEDAPGGRLRVYDQGPIALVRTTPDLDLTPSAARQLARVAGAVGRH